MSDPQTTEDEDWQQKYSLCKAALDSMCKLYVGEVVFEGWLSPEVRVEVKIHGNFGYRELDALIKKLEVDKGVLFNAWRI